MATISVALPAMPETFPEDLTDIQIHIKSFLYNYQPRRAEDAKRWRDHLTVVLLEAKREMCREIREQG